jgi:hypothetical protein
MCARPATGGTDQTGHAGRVPARERGVTVRPFPSSRRLVTAAVHAGRRIVPMHGLFDVDVTAAGACSPRVARRCR